MAEYYTGINRRSDRKRGKRSRRSFLLFLLDCSMTVVMAVLLFCTASILIGQYISPAKMGILSVIPLGAPVIYLLDIAVMFYWVVRWRWYRASIMIVAVVCGSLFLSRYYKISFDRQYDTTYNEREYSKVMTYNVLEGKKPELLTYIEQHDPDILCVQELTPNTDNCKALATKYKTTFDADDKDSEVSGCQILSKYPILRSGAIDGLLRRNGVWADLKVADDTVRVVNLHLQSTSIRPEDTKFIEGHEYIRDKERDSKMRSIVVRLAENNRARAVQAESVAKFLKSSNYKVIVCGDFNDVPLSYTYNVIADNLDDSFAKMANGFAYTYNTKYHLLRIDNILVSPSIEVASYDVDNKIDLSDHYPVVARVKVDVGR